MMESERIPTDELLRRRAMADMHESEPQSDIPRTAGPRVVSAARAVEEAVAAPGEPLSGREKRARMRQRVAYAFGNLGQAAFYNALSI